MVQANQQQRQSLHCPLQRKRLFLVTYSVQVNTLNGEERGKDYKYNGTHSFPWKVLPYSHIKEKGQSKEEKASESILIRSISPDDDEAKDKGRVSPATQRPSSVSSFVYTTLY